MANKAGSQAPFIIVFGGDAYLNKRTGRDLIRRALHDRPDAERIDLDATGCDQYAFDEAVSPSLLADVAVVVVDNLQNADDKLGESMVRYCRQACADPGASSIVICRHEGGVKGKRLLDQLVKAGACKETVADLKKPESKLNFVLQIFEGEHRRVEPLAAQQLVAVLGERTGEMAAMCSQLCFDFDDDPITLDLVNRYLTSNPQVTGFSVADKAIAGRTAEAIIAMRSAVEQGTDPIALIGGEEGVFDRRARDETAHHRQGIRSQGRHHHAGSGENEPVGAEKRHETAFGLDLGGTRAVHPHARLGGRTEQNQRGRPRIRAGEVHRTDQPQRKGLTAPENGALRRGDHGRVPAEHA